MIVSTAERRLLVTNTDRDLLEFIINVATDTLGISIRQVMPGGPTDDDIVQFACLNSWDFAFLIVNNIRYPEEDTIPSGALKLISNLGRFNKPIIASYGWPAADYLINDLLAAGAAAAFRIPCGAGTVAEAFRAALNGAAPNNHA